ncbi:hypothetical protein GCM10011594_12110 [Nakamurella endophytica]|uniref:Actinobacteria/chloroflexi VLRF1 release factor domain-containing protein n=1 Tax=Nakamurella endophytica TaxID=1748367 RepID=A0A917WDY8_9ACTN|nr:hypothetical protein GCM10011594_12110 [Nakamurella endophytica]
MVGWVNRFAGRNDGLAGLSATADAVLLTAVDGTTATLAVPFPPMSTHGREPVEALLHHLADLGVLGILLVRAGAHSVGLARAGVVVSSSTERSYVQGRTAAGGWSQQRYQRRRGNQLTAALDDTVAVAARLLVPRAGELAGLVAGGDASAVDRVLADPRLARLRALPRRFFGDVPEPRRAVLDEVAGRALQVLATVRPPGARPLPEGG